MKAHGRRGCTKVGLWGRTGDGPFGQNHPKKQRSRRCHVSSSGLVPEPRHKQLNPATHRRSQLDIGVS